MPLEAATTFADLDNTWPLGGDPILSGDNHLRLIKSVLKAQFPGSIGQGLDTAITATEAELNYLVGVTSSIQDQLDAITSNDNLVAPTGTVMVFYQASPPVGWTQVPTHDDKMLRVVSASGGGSGGTDSPTTFDHVHATSDHVLVEAELPIHHHEQNGRDVLGAEGGDGGHNWAFGDNQLGGALNPGSVFPSGYDTLDAGSNIAHNHGDTEITEFRPLYIDTILASKD